jgi:hypothetical protein
MRLNFLGHQSSTIHVVCPGMWCRKPPKGVHSR